MSCILGIHCIFGLLTFVSSIWSQEVDFEGRSQAKYVQRKWITQLMDEAKRGFDLDSTVNEKCQRDFRLYKLHLANQSIWAIRMLESSEWPSVGLYAGTTYSLGNWKECLRVAEYDIQGQYCLVEANFDWPEDNIVEHVWSDEKASVWDALGKYKKMPWLLNRQNLHWALCIPASCQPSEIALSLNQTLRPIFENQGMRIQIHVEANLCSQSIDSRTPSKGFYIFWIFTKIILAVIIFATVYHLMKNDDAKESESRSLGFEMLTSFSIIRNYKNLTAVAPDDLPSLYLAKIIYMFIMLFAHRIVFFYSFPFFSSEAIEMDVYSDRSILFAVFPTGFIMVEIFFMFSGFVSFTAHLSKMKAAEGWLVIIEHSLYRWARMIPVYMYTLAILIYVLPSLSNGPLWYQIVTEAERCKSSFWPNFFAVSNLFNSEKLCLFHSWYPSVDIQLSIIAAVILFVYVRNERLGTYLTVLVFSVGTAYTFVYAYINKYHGVLPVFLTSPYFTWRNSEEFLNVYISTSTRIPYYFIGFACGIITKYLAERQFKVTEGNVFVLFILLIWPKIAIINYIPELNEFTKPYNRLENAFSAAVIRSLFVLPEAFMVCAYVISRKCKYLLFFDNPVWIPLGRLLYGIYCISVVIQFYHSASHQVLMPSYSLIYVAWLFIGDVVYSIIASFILYMMIQAPMSNLLKICIRESMRQVYAVLKASKLSANGITQSANGATHIKKL